MAGTPTPNFGLPQYDRSDTGALDTLLNGITSQLDTSLKVAIDNIPENYRIGTDADRLLITGGSLYEGLKFRTTDTKIDWTYTGDAWVPFASAWVPIVLSTGWTGVSGHTPQVKLIGGVVYMEGAASRGVGGALNNIGVIPEPFRLITSGGKTTFVAGHVALRSGSAAVAEIYVQETGVVRCDTYTTIDSNPGWVVPISGSYPRDMR